MKKTKVLVTGSHGFISSHLRERLKKECEIICFDTLRGLDITNQHDVFSHIRDLDAVFHLAAVADLNWARVHPIETMKINIKGTWNIAYACAKHEIPLFYASTMCVYGNQRLHPSTEETKPNPSEIYACSKLAGENVIMGFHHTYGLKYNFMRFATIYGEGCRPALGTHIFLGQALRGEPITIHGNGKQTRTLTYVGDLVEAIYCLYKSGKINDVWNLTHENEISANEMATVAKEITKSKSEISYIPQRVGQTFKEQISADKMRREVGWEAKTEFEDGMRKMLKWFNETDQISKIYELPK